MPQISIIIKPASSSCNLDCKYCFYKDEDKQRSNPIRGYMSGPTFEIIARKAFDYALGDNVFISFQGGEPLLSGKGFFKTALSILDKTNKYNSPVYLSIQTNGTLIDDEWCDLFKENNILVGLSLDGDAIANKNRVDNNGNEVFERVLYSARKLKQKDVQFNILSVLTRENALRIDKIYSFFMNEGFFDMQFIPCLKPTIGECNNEYYLDTKSYKLYLLSAFAMYQRDRHDGKYVSIRQFDNFVRLAKFQPAEQCGMNGYCTRQFVIEADGDVYPCDYYCSDGYKLGNILKSTFATLEKTENHQRFLKESLTLPLECKACKYFMLCKGGCKRERQDIDKCDAYKTFFKFAIPYLKDL